MKLYLAAVFLLAIFGAVVDSSPGELTPYQLKQRLTYIFEFHSHDQCDECQRMVKQINQMVTSGVTSKDKLLDVLNEAYCSEVIPLQRRQCKESWVHAIKMDLSGSQQVCQYFEFC